MHTCKNARCPTPYYSTACPAALTGCMDSRIPGLDAAMHTYKLSHSHIHYSVQHNNMDNIIPVHTHGVQVQIDTTLYTIYCCRCGLYECKYPRMSMLERPREPNLGRSLAREPNPGDKKRSGRAFHVRGIACLFLPLCSVPRPRVNQARA